MANRSRSTAGSQAERLRKKRQQAKQRQLILTLSVITGVALIVVALIAYGNDRVRRDIVDIVPKNYPSVDGRKIGNPEAPVMIELFEDFQCPACGFFSEQVKPQILANLVNTGQAQLEFHHYAFIGVESRQAANASMCALEQERFWDYHDILFANQKGENIGAFSNRRLVVMAEILELDMDSFNTCFDEKRYQSDIDQDFVLGGDYQIPGTPTVVVNGRVLPDFQFATVMQAVQEATLETIQ